jgi:hypothetical protein
MTPHNLAEAILAATEVEGASPPKIVDRIIEQQYPRTVTASKIEGAYTYFRDGLVAYVRAVLKRGGVEDSDDRRQRDLSEIDADFRPMTTGLSHTDYFVPSRGVFVSLADLLRHLDQFDEARRYLRRKGEETIREADKLDELYFAAMAAAARQRRGDRELERAT